MEHDRGRQLFFTTNPIGEEDSEVRGRKKRHLMASPMTWDKPTYLNP